MRRLVLAVAAALVACGGEDGPPAWPGIEGLYRVEGGVPTCVAPVFEGGTDVRHECTWENVLVAGEPACYGIALFTRPDAGSEWSVSVHRSAAACY